MPEARIEPLDPEKRNTDGGAGAPATAHFHVHPDHTLELAQRMDALVTELSNDIAGIDIDAVPLGPERKQLLI
ncbi:hypothetical protein T492DRAFT_870666 [Pavlovales sp. CCMP2436]|nr:hypothetical protein T492DRAFT_870666 [Pavlovales sp. CCMP2436]